MSVSANGQGPREKSRTPKAKLNSDAPTTPLLIGQTPASSTPAANDDSSKCSLGGKTASKCGDWGSSFVPSVRSSQCSKLQHFRPRQRHEVPQNFRRLLSSRLRRLVTQDKLEKVQNCYRIKIDILPGTVAPTPKQKEIQPRQSRTTFFLASTEQEASENAAYKVADAENKTFVAAEASKEKDRVSKLADNANDVLLLAQEIFDQSSRGEIVLVV